MFQLKTDREKNESVVAVDNLDVILRFRTYPQQVMRDLVVLWNGLWPCKDMMNLWQDPLPMQRMNLSEA